MAKGLKMHHARTRRGEVKSVLDMTSGDVLHCEHCGASVSFVPEHTRSGIAVSAYLRLKTGAEHNHECKYTAHSHLRYLAGLGEDLENSRRPLVLLRDGSYQLRLGIPLDDMRSLKENMSVPLTADTRKARIEQIWSGKQLAPYCRTAAGVARMAALLDQQDDIRKLVRISHGKTEIDWSSFYFGDDDGDRLVHYLRSETYRRSAHPIAVLVRPRTQQNNHMQCFSDPGRSSPAKLIPRLYGRTSILSELSIGEEYLVLGRWYASQTSNTSSDGKVTFDNIGVGVHQRVQFCKLIQAESSRI